MWCRRTRCRKSSGIGYRWTVKSAQTACVEALSIGLLLLLSFLTLGSMFILNV
jgi:hypothetical protein